LKLFAEDKSSAYSAIPSQDDRTVSPEKHTLLALFLNILRQQPDHNFTM